MALTELTKITGPGIKTDTNFVGNNAHFTGITTTDGSFNVGVTTIHSNLAEIHNVVSTGVITATKFIGDGSDLTSLPAGLGTALHPAVNTPLNSIFYVNDTLHVTQNSVVTLPPESFIAVASIPVNAAPLPTKLPAVTTPLIFSPPAPVIPIPIGR